MTLRDALDRTLRLMRDEIHEGADDALLLEALTGTRVAIIADRHNITSHSAQTAFVTAAMLMARSGHQVYLLAPDVSLVGFQPPLRSGCMIDQLVQAGENMLPGIKFMTFLSAAEVDLAIALGDSPIPISARRRIRLNADPWAGHIAREDDVSSWKADEWPFGAMASAALAAGEVFKAAMQKLQAYARNPERLATVFANTDQITFVLAPPDTPHSAALGRFDCVSGGAITNAVLYALLRLPGVSGHARVIEPQTADLSNMNRYALLLRCQVENLKADILADISTESGLRIEPLARLYDPELFEEDTTLAPFVLVGVDDIPTRWAVQQTWPEWLGVGATTHWSAMSSFHQAGLGCAQCLHPYDDPNTDPIPTVAFVSFWGGLLTAAYFLRHTSGELIPANEQQTYLTSFRAENPFRGPVYVRADCPTCGRPLFPAQDIAG